MKILKWNKETKLTNLPKCYRRLIPPTADLEELDEHNQMDHVRFRVMHEIDITDEEGIEETGITWDEYRNAKRFMRLTGGVL